MWRISVERTAYNLQHGKVKITSNTPALRAMDTIFGFLGTIATTAAKGDPDAKKDVLIDEHKLTPMQESQVKLLGEKASKLGFECQIRVVAVAPTQETADQLQSRFVLLFINSMLQNLTG
jgi:hypothetical protein